jgi:hypothetical protein
LLPPNPDMGYDYQHIVEVTGDIEQIDLPF